MNAREAWGLPDWTDRLHTPSGLTAREWRWEFLRRLPDYRTEWGRWRHRAEDRNGVLIATADDPDRLILHFGVAVIFDPRRSFDDWSLMSMFRPSSGFIVRYDPRERDDDRFADYRFDLSCSLAPQLAKARKHLEAIQTERPKAPRPSRELWDIYLRVIDARDCGASWLTIGRTLWPLDQGNVKDKARNVHSQAQGVWFNGAN